MNRYLIIGMALGSLCFGGCATRTGTFPHSSETRVDLSKKNYRVVRANAVGESTGFGLLWFIPIVPPRYTDAMSKLYAMSNVTEGSAYALANVTQERADAHFIIFFLPKLIVRGDFIEFMEEEKAEEVKKE